MRGRVNPVLASLVLLLGTLVPAMGSAGQVSWHAAARYNVSTANPDYRSRAELGARYRPMLTDRLGLDVGGLLQFENGLPVQERLRYEGNWVRHWGVGLRMSIVRSTNDNHSRKDNSVHLLASFQRTTRGYAIDDAGDDQGYYVSPAVGAEVNLSLVGKPVTVKLELAPWTLKSWRLGAKDLLVRARVDRLSITAAHVTPSKDQQAYGAPNAWGVVAALRVVGPVTVSGGWDLLPGSTARSALRPVAFAGIGVQVDGGRR